MNFTYYRTIDSKKVLAKKRRNRAKKEKVKNSVNVEKVVPAVILVAATTVNSVNTVLADTRLLQIEPLKTEARTLPEVNLLDFNAEAEVEEKTVEEQINNLVFFSKMQAFERNLEAQRLMKEAVEAEQAEKIRAESFFSTMREMHIESKLSVKLAKISDNLNSLSNLKENHDEAKALERKIASQMEKLKQDLKEYPKQFEGLKLSLRSEKKRLKKCKQLREEYEEAQRQARIQAQRELEALRSFYYSLTPYSDVSQNLGLSKERFQEILSVLPYDYVGLFQKNSGFFWELADKYNFNEFLLVGICAWESLWGKTPVNANNFSSQRIDETTYYTYDSAEEGIAVLARNLAINYLPENGIYYNGKNLVGINVKYCETNDWYEGVCACMKMVIREYLATIE